MYKGIQIIWNDHNFEQNEDRVTVILKWTDFNKDDVIIIDWQIYFL